MNELKGFSTGFNINFPAKELEHNCPNNDDDCIYIEYNKSHKSFYIYQNDSSDRIYIKYCPFCGEELIGE